MQLAGWTLDMWKVGGPFVSQAVMMNMAGNAFSAFAVTPVIVVTWALAGMPAADDKKTQSDTESDADMSSG